MQSYSYNLIISILAMASVMCGAPASAAATKCLTGKRMSLIRRNFSGPLVCSHRDSSFQFVGKTAGTGFSVYDYRYRYLPLGGQVMHGGQRVLIFHGEDYEGQYALATPPYSTVTVSGSYGVIKTLGTPQAVRLNFSSKPPTQVMVNGEIANFFR